MDFAPVKELPGRVRVKLRGPVPEGDVSALEQVVRACPDVTKATVYPRNGEIAISYAAGEGVKERVFCHLVGIKAADIEVARELAAYDPSAQTRALVQDILWLVGSHYARRWFLPAPLRTAWTVWSYRHFLATAFDSLAHGRLDVPVLDAAAARNLQHCERHAEVEYIVAHGISSSLDGKRCVIGSEHFVVEDEGVVIDEAAHARIIEAFGAISSLYLAVDGELVGVIGIHDPIKPGVPEAVAQLRRLGFRHIVMLTGDNERAAAPVAAQAGITEFCANMLPEQKHSYVPARRRRGRRGPGRGGCRGLSTYLRLKLTADVSRCSHLCVKGVACR